jgi:hypothetical protein
MRDRSALAVVVSARGPDPEPRRDGAPATVDSGPANRSPTSTATAARTWLTIVRGDGAATILVFDRSYRITLDPNDEVAVGDWDCDGIATPAVLRVPSGALDVFDRWPGEPGQQAARRVGVAVGAVRLPPPVGACASPAPLGPDGTPVAVLSNAHQLREHRDRAPQGRLARRPRVHGLVAGRPEAGRRCRRP